MKTGQKVFLARLLTGHSVSKCSIWYDYNKVEISAAMTTMWMDLKKEGVGAPIGKKFNRSIADKPPGVEARFVRGVLNDTDVAIMLIDVDSGPHYQVSVRK